MGSTRNSVPEFTWVSDSSSQPHLIPPPLGLASPDLLLPHPSPTLRLPLAPAGKGTERMHTLCCILSMTMLLLSGPAYAQSGDVTLDASPSARLET